MQDLLMSKHEAFIKHQIDVDILKCADVHEGIVQFLEGGLSPCLCLWWRVG